MFFHKETRLSTEIFYVVSEGYACSCKGFHVNNRDCRCSSCNTQFSESEPWKDGWTCDVLFPQMLPSAHLPISTPTMGVREVDIPVQRHRLVDTNACIRTSEIETDLSSSQRIHHPENQEPKKAQSPTERAPRRGIFDSGAEGEQGDLYGVPPAQDQVSISEAFDPHDTRTHHRPGDSDVENKSFLRFLDDVKSELPLVSLQDLVHPRRRNVAREKRLEFAFRLSAFLLRLSATPWVDNSRPWNNWDISIGHMDEKAPYSQRSGRDFYSLQVSINKASDSVPPPQGLARQLTLTKIGIILIEVAYGQSLTEIRQQSPDLLVGTALNEHEQGIDQYLLDFLTAKQLLSSRRIRNAFGIDFEDAVGACIYRQYQEFRSLAIKELDMTQESFLEDAKLAILAPLYREILKYSQYVNLAQHSFIRLLYNLDTCTDNLCLGADAMVYTSMHRTRHMIHTIRKIGLCMIPGTPMLTIPSLLILAIEQNGKTTQLITELKATPFLPPRLEILKEATAMFSTLTREANIRLNRLLHLLAMLKSVWVHRSCLYPCNVLCL